jgi:glycosyltransferase involved in cell wall biosynthesis
MRPRFSIIIPAYNEENTVAKAAWETKRAFDALGEPYEIIVVDDGSTDRTSSIVTDLSIRIPQLRIVIQPTNLGKGAAVKAGVMEAKGDIFLFLDSDLATNPSEFASFIPYFRNHDIVIGSRRVAGANIAKRQSLYRTWIGRLFNVIVRTYLDLPFHDTQCGFKAFAAKTKPLFQNMQTSGWAFDVELLMKAIRRGYRIMEVPVMWRHGRESRVRIGQAYGILEDLRKIKNARV